MRLFLPLFSLVAFSLTLFDLAEAFSVSVTQVSCERLYFTLTLAPQEYRVAQTLELMMGGQEVSEVGLGGSYTPTTLSAEFYAVFYDGDQPSSGPADVTFTLLNANSNNMTSSAAVTKNINFQCGVILTSSASAPRHSSTSKPGSGDDSSSSSSSNKSSTGAIVGGVVGGIIALAAIAIVAFFLVRKRRRQQRRHGLGHHDMNESASRMPNDSTASLSTSPEHASSPMMHNVSSTNVFADPSISNSPPASINPERSGFASAAAATAVAAVMASKKPSGDQSSFNSPSLHNEKPPLSNTPPNVAFVANNAVQTPVIPKPVAKDIPPTVPESAPIPAPAPIVPAPPQPKPSTPKLAPAPAIIPAPASISKQPESRPNNLANPASSRHSPVSPSAPATAPSTPEAGKDAAALAASAAATETSKKSKWGFKTPSYDAKNKTSPYATPVDAQSLSSSTPSSKSQKSQLQDATASPRSFRVIHKPQSAPTTPNLANLNPSSASVSPSESSTSRLGQRVPSNAPSVASLVAGFGEAPSLPPPAPSVMSSASEEFGGNMAGIGAGRAMAMRPSSSAHSTKWHQQHYNVMPSFSSRALVRSSQLEEDLIFGNLGMGLSPPLPPPSGPAGSGSESGSTRSRRDPFGEQR